jgi:hypothetical protein
MRTAILRLLETCEGLFVICSFIPPALGTCSNGPGSHDACARRVSIAAKTAAAINDSGAPLRRVRAPPLDAVGLCSLKSNPCE